MAPGRKRLIFASNFKDPQQRNFDIFLINLDGTGLEQVTFNETFDGFPMFSPDGTAPRVRVEPEREDRRGNERLHRGLGQLGKTGRLARQLGSSSTSSLICQSASGCGPGRMSAMSGSTPGGSSQRSGPRRARSASRAALSLRFAIRACPRCRLLVVGRERCAIECPPPPARRQVQHRKMLRNNMILHLPTGLNAP